MAAEESKPVVSDLPEFRDWYLEISPNDSGCKVAMSIELDSNVETLPKITCNELLAQNSKIRSIPASAQIGHRLAASGCSQLMELPRGLKVDVLELQDCISLAQLPEDMEVYSLDVSGCTGLRMWPQSMQFKSGVFAMAGCSQLSSIPNWLKRVSELDVSRCANLRELPEDLEITGCIHLAGSGLTKLPARCAKVPIRWNGVLINETIAFAPEMLTPSMVLDEENIERRRVMLERIGIERFLAQVNAEVIDKDTDPGGDRSLLRVSLKNDEDVVCLSVSCPSTGRNYVLRVPPTIMTCHAAAAWIAGFDDPNEYNPLVET